MQELAKVPFFERLNREELAQLSSIARRRPLGADVAIFFEGDLSDALYVLVSGSAKVYSTADDGTVQIIETFVAGDLFGEYSMLDGAPRSATVATLEPSEILSIDYHEFRDLASRSPSLLWRIMESLAGRMRRQNAALQELSRRDVPYRLLSTLQQLAEKHGELAQGGRRLKVPLSPRDLAGMVASTPERVSRLLHRFEVSGLVSRGDHGAGAQEDGDAAARLVIPDMKALARALEYTSDWA